MIVPFVKAPHRERLIAGVCCPEELLDVTKASLLVASEEYPALDVEGYESRLARMGSEFAARARNASPEDGVLLLSEYLFAEQGFRGNGDDYYDPRNSFLNEVLDRRMGIPISLSAVYLDIARRAGMEAAGVSFPGHFLVRVEGEYAPIIVDPYNGGIRLTKEDCQDRLDRIFSGKVALKQDMLARCGKRAMLVRLLRNLKGIYVKTGDHDRALRTVELILLIEPASRPDKRDKGLILAAMDCYASAADALEAYITVAPGASEAPTLASKVKELRQKAARIN